MIPLLPPALPNQCPPPHAQSQLLPHESPGAHTWTTEAATLLGSEPLETGSELEPVRFSH